MADLPPLRLGVMGSGVGSNFEAIARAIEEGGIPAKISVVLSDQPEAPILQKARARNIPTQVINPREDEVIASLLLSHGVELVVLAGYMRLVGKSLLQSFPRRVLNIHPSLLPRFPGLHPIRKALEAGVEETGCTVHYVDDGMDTGHVIAQARVRVLPGDTVDSLRLRIHAAEHRLFPEVIRQIACQRQVA